MSADNRDAVSRSMGSMLLQGYKMLADSCPTCSNVLMQDKKGVNICVNCNLTKELEPTTTGMDVDQARHAVIINAGDFQPKRKHPNGDRYQVKAIQAAEEALCQEMQYASDVLIINPPLDLPSRLVHVQFIKECAEALKSLHGIQL